MVDLTGAEVIVVPGPCRGVWFPTKDWFAILYVLTPEERGSFWVEGAVRVQVAGVGPVAFVVAEQV